jgi:hypothetical protein
MLTPSQKGAVAEAAVTLAAVRMDLTVLRPTCEGRRYDLVIDVEPELLRVQCKWARRLDGVLSIGLKTSRYTPHGYVFTSYSADEVDAIAAFSPDTQKCYLIPIEEVAGRRALYLRLDPTKNNQALRVKWAADYEFETAIARRVRSKPVLSEWRGPPHLREISDASG